MPLAFEKLGPYRVGRQLGRGGMGTVFAAVDEETGQAAAVKVHSAMLAQDDGFRARFEGEIETLRMLRHPNIVRLFGFGEHEGHLFYAMELVAGTSLEEQLREGKRFDWRTATTVGIDMARALRHAHDRGVIHRDIKPANILRTAEGVTKLSDFGIARLFGSVRLTAAGGVIGTAEYMAPEQADGRPVTPKADLYSLGGVLYAMLAGRPPFEARSLPEMLQLQRFATPNPVSDYAPETPRELEQIIAELLAKEPEDRIANAMLLARRLEATSHGLARREQSQTVVRGAVADEPDVTSVDRTACEALPETLAATQIAVPQAGQRDEPAPVGDPLKQTAAATDERPPAEGEDVRSEAFSLAPAVQMSAESRASQTEAPQAGQTRVVSRFTAVDETDATEIGLETEGRGALISPQTWALVAALVLTAAGVWYFLQPPTADQLYQQVSSAAGQDDVAALAAVSGQIREFLTLYSNDPRAGEMRDYQSQVELYETERRFGRRARLASAVDGLAPIELAYLDAIRLANIDPQRAVDKLEALLAVYGDDNAENETNARCLELARQQIDHLRGEAALAAREQLDAIRHRLAHAAELEGTDPAAALAIFQGLVVLYGDKPWAAAEIEQARQAASRLEKSPDQATSSAPSESSAASETDDRSLAPGAEKP